MDRAPVELVVSQFVLSAQKFEVGHRNRGQQRPELAAARAITGNDFANIGLRFEADLSALAAAGIGFFHR
jgi:hypothetical protein